MIEGSGKDEIYLKSGKNEVRVCGESMNYETVRSSEGERKEVKV